MGVFILWGILLVVASVMYYRQFYSKFRQRGVKYITPIPLLGNMAGMLLGLEHFTGYLQRAYNMFPNERFFGNYEFTSPLLVIRDLELVKQITIKDSEHFLDHRTAVDDKIDPFWGRSLFSLKGNDWKDMRSTLSPAFTSSKIRLMVPFMAEVGEQMISSLKKQIKESGSDAIEIDTKDLSTRYANDVIASCAFGLKVNSHTQHDNSFYVMGKEASTFKFRQMLMFFAYNSFPWLMTKLKMTIFSETTQKYFKTIILKTMKDREEHNIVRPDMIHLLMEAKKGKLFHEDKTKDADAGFATVEESSMGKNTTDAEWSENDLIAQALIFLLGGFDTVASVLVFALHELAIHPEVQDRLVEEIKEYDAKNGGKFDFNDMQKMVYMDMVISEVLRMWTPGFMIDRICIKDYNLGKPNKDATNDYIIRKGEGVVVPVWSFHRNPEFFSDPDKFDPERFSEENKHNIKPMTYVPFGIGPRNCIGKNRNYNTYRYTSRHKRRLRYQRRKMAVYPPETVQLKCTSGGWAAASSSRQLRSAIANTLVRRGLYGQNSLILEEGYILKTLNRWNVVDNENLYTII